MRIVIFMSFVPIMFSIVVLCLPEVNIKGNVVKIGTLIRKTYDLHQYRFVVQSEKRYKRPTSNAGTWCVCIYVYPKNDLTAASIRTHLLPSRTGFRKSALKKEQKIKNLLNENISNDI